MIQPGDHFWAANQGRNITPETVGVTVVAIDGPDIWYRIDGEWCPVCQTTIDRFKEIVGISK